MEITEEIRANHRDHSVVAEEFLDYVLAQPERPKELNWETGSLPSWVLEQYPYPLQKFPTFIDPKKLREVEDATVGVLRLVRSLPERIFHNDAKKFSDHFGLNNELLAFLLLEPPNGLADSLARCDLVDSPNGFKCLEFNLGKTIGGWQVRFWEKQFRESPMLSNFLQDRQLHLFYRDPLLYLFQHLVETALKTRRKGDDLHLAIILDSGMAHLDHVAEAFNQAYSTVLAKIDPALRGEVLLCTYPDGVKTQGTTAYVDGKRVAAIVEYGQQETTPQEVFRCFKSGEVLLSGGPLVEILNTKGLLVLLSEAEDSEEFDAEERDIIRRYIPWSRDLKAGTTKYRGEKVSLLDLLLTHRKDFVLKPHLGSSGQGISVGRFTPQDEWEQAIQRHVASTEKWLVQEYVGSRSYLYLHEDRRLVPHDMVWGTFGFGGSFGGGFLRMMAQDLGSGIINSATGASEGVIFEISGNGSSGE